MPKIKGAQTIAFFVDDFMQAWVKCDESHHHHHFSSFFPYIFLTITTMGGKLPTKRHNMQHSQAFRLSWLAQSILPLWLTWHYQDYDVNYDDSGGLLSCYSLHFLIQCSLLWPAFTAASWASLHSPDLMTVTLWASPLYELSSLFIIHYQVSHVCALLYNSISFSIHYCGSLHYISHSL